MQKNFEVFFPGSIKQCYKTKNIWFEYNERAHNRRKEKDERRKQEIINFLHCKFIEIFENFI